MRILFGVLTSVVWLACLSACHCRCERGDSALSTPMPTAPTTFLPRSLTLRDTTYAYAITVPAKYSSAKAMPMIVFLNGSGECGTDGLKQTTQGLGNALRAHPEAWPFVCVFPQKPESSSTWMDHEDLVLATIERTRAELNIDPARIYLTGLSQGGRGTWAIGTHHPELFAALAPVCGYGPNEQLGTNIKSLPIWAFHGDADTVLSVEESRRLAKAAYGLGAEVKLTIYMGVDHNCWDKAYQEDRLAEWFLTHARK